MAYPISLGMTRKKTAIRAESPCHGAETQKTTQAQIITFSSNSILTALAGRLQKLGGYSEANLLSKIIFYIIFKEDVGTHTFGRNVEP